MVVHGFEFLGLRECLFEGGLLGLTDFEPLTSFLDELLEADELVLVGIQLHFLLGLGEGGDELAARFAHPPQKLLIE